MQEDFVNVDKEWNEFKVTDACVDPDKVFASLDDYSKTLKEFEDRCAKDALNFLSKIEVAMLDNYQCIFTLLDTDTEHKKTSNVKLKPV